MTVSGSSLGDRAAAGSAAVSRLVATLRRRGRIQAIVQVMAVRVIALVANLATGMISAAILGPAGRGVQAALMVGPQFIGGVSEFGLHGSVIYNAKVEPRFEGEYLGCALLLGLATGLVGMTFGWLLAPMWLHKYSADTIVTARWMLTIVPLGVVMHVLIAGLEGRGEFGLANRLMLSASVVTLVALGVLTGLGRLTPATAAASYLFSTVPIFIAMGWHVRRIIRPTATLRTRLVRRLLHYGMRFYGVDLFGALGDYVDQIIVVLLLDPRSLGIYAVAVSASRVLSVISTSVSTVLFPAMAARSSGDIAEIVGVAARVTSVIAAAAAVALALVGPFLLHTLYGEKFDSAVEPFRWLLVDSVVSNFVWIFYQVFAAAGRAEIVTGLEAVGLSVSALSMLVLVPRYGTTGAAISLLVASTVRLACMLGCFRLIMRLPMPRLILSRSDLAHVMRRSPGL